MYFISPFHLYTNCSTDKKLNEVIAENNLDVSESGLKKLIQQRDKLRRFINNTTHRVIDDMELPAAPVKEKKVTPTKASLSKADVKKNIDSELKKVKDVKDEANIKNYDTEDEFDDEEEDDEKTTKPTRGFLSLKDPAKKTKSYLEKFTLSLLTKRLPEILTTGAFILIDKNSNEVSYALLNKKDTDFIKKRPRRAGKFGVINETKEEILQGELENLNIDGEEEDRYYDEHI
jgi:arsenate reductase-like glutaredoxin family protein